MSKPHATSLSVPRTYAYPAELARFVRERWHEVPAAPGPDVPLADLATLERFFSACYQASLLREEAQGVTFRAVLAPPELFPLDGMPPESMQRLEFARSFPFVATELRRLSAAADPRRTLIGVRSVEDDLAIWGLVRSGARWLRDVRGGRRAGAPLAAAPVVHVDAPGSLAVYKGSELVAKLQLGRLSGWRRDAFASEWLAAQFAPLRHEVMALHERASKRARERGEAWAPLQTNLPREISHRVLKRAIALLREAQHGGTIAFVPQEFAGDLYGSDPYIDLKYRFLAAGAQRSFSAIVVDILNRLAHIAGAAGNGSTPVGWRDFERAADYQLSALDEALFETAYLIASLASADGAVVMNLQHQLLGFGGMISSRCPAVRSVARALDLEAEAVAEEGTENVGARHRSAYRLAGAQPGTVVIVVSQDGDVRFVAHKEGRVTYWEQG